jgi:hypothetical protein
MSIAKTIHAQIKALDFWAFGAWGAKNITAHSDGLSFKTSGSVRWKGIVKIMLDEGKDLYVLKFMRVRKMQLIVDKIVEDVFVEDLVRFIDEQVG